MEAKRAAEELMNLKKQEEDLADYLDLFEFAAKTNKHTWRHGGRTYNS
jgi:hypothetical protein